MAFYDNEDETSVPYDDIDADGELEEDVGDSSEDYGELIMPTLSGYVSEFQGMSNDHKIDTLCLSYSSQTPQTARVVQ